MKGVTGRQALKSTDPLSGELLEAKPTDITCLAGAERNGRDWVRR